MSEDVETSRRDYRPPHSSKHPIPTIQGYKDLKQKQRENLASDDGSTTHKPSEGRGQDEYQPQEAQHPPKPDETEEGKLNQDDLKDTSQVDPAAGDPKARRKHMKHRTADRAEREVTDPVTHLPVTIHDFTDADLKEQRGDDDEGSEAEEFDVHHIHASANSKKELDRAQHEQMSSHEWLESIFPPPSFQNARNDLQKLYGTALLITATIVLPVFGVMLSLSSGLLHGSKSWFSMGSIAGVIVLILAMAVCAAVAFGIQQWTEKKMKQVWEDEVWEAQRRRGEKRLHSDEPETTMWFNKFVGSIWPLVNPDLFLGLADTLEDVMQASLPKLVRMVSIEDMGQGSDSIRFLGIRWLPKGAAHRSVDNEGNLSKSNEKKEAAKAKRAGDDIDYDQGGQDAATDANERSTAAEDGDNDGKGQESTVAAGMESEEGDFVNLEIAFAYRATHAKKMFRDRAKHAHLYLAFYLPGNIKLPVWVELRGLIGTIRVRMQITPDPPFVQLCTLTFMGQPKVDISCVPLVKYGLNIMDVPLISNFVQSAVDAAMSEYVAPKSYTIDLKAMLAGDDFKKDTSARGVLVVRIKRAFDYKAADMHIPVIRKGSSDPYVSVGWAKFGKPLWSTRVLVDEMSAYFDEETHILVGPEELDAEENIRVQLWDSDRTTADDDLGRIEIPIKHLMRNEKSNGRMWDRIDSFQALKKGESMPGRLEWSVGYYTKTRLMDYQVQHTSKDENVQTVKQLKEKSYEQSKNKLREAAEDETAEIEQLQRQDFEDASIDIISRSSPSEDYPSGILSIQIHQVVGLELEKLNRPRDQDGGEPDVVEDETDDKLPDSYCTIILNDNKIYKTRTKPKSGNPFFNAGTERFIRDWRTASIFVSVRDARVHEDHPLLGLVHLALGPILREKRMSRFDGFHPLAGGIGYGRVRLSVVFRSIQLQAPPRALGWNYGTLEIRPEVEVVGNLPQELLNHRLKFRTSMGKGKMHAGSSDGAGKWSEKHGHPLYLAVRNRYAANLVVEFRSHSTFRDKTPAFSVLWLQSIPDEEEQTLELVVWKGDLARAEANVLPEDQSGEKLGSIRVRLTFWRGLGKWHEPLGKRSPDVQNMLEVLDAANDENLIDCVVGDPEWLRRRDRGEAPSTGETTVSSSDSDSDSEGDRRDNNENTNTNTNPRASSSSTSTHLSRQGRDQEEGGILDDLKSYARNKKELHRKQRGIMQWKAPRTLDWVKHKTESVVEKIESKFDHRERKAGIETEV